MFFKDMKCGHGVQIEPDGTRRMGEFRAGKLHGGCVSISDGQAAYEAWVEGSRRLRKTRGLLSCEMQQRFHQISLFFVLFDESAQCYKCEWYRKMYLVSTHSRTDEFVARSFNAALGAFKSCRLTLFTKLNGIFVYL
jgi:hypothetical protein